MKRIIAGSIVGVSVLSGVIFKCQFDRSESLREVIHVEGEAEEQIKADLFEWNFTFESIGDEVQEVKENVKKTKKDVMAMLTDVGLVRGEDFEIKPKQLSITKTDQGKNVVRITQDYEIKTPKIEAAERAWKNSETLIEKGISLNGGYSDRYQIKDKTKIQQRLQIAAIKDGREKAEKLAADLGGKIIGMPSGGWSYVQIKDLNTSEDSWKSGSSVDQIAKLGMSMQFNVEKKK
jgi:hypothetical protein